MKFKNYTYDILKFVAQVVLPALATLIIALGNIWTLPCTTEISATLVAVDTFLGALLHVSTQKYNKEVEDE